MAKTGFVLIFALVLLLSIHLALGTGSEDFMNQAKDSANDAASKMKGAAEGLSESAGDAMKDAQETTSTWADWFKGKFTDMGMTGDNSEDDHSEAPSEA